MTKPHKTPPLSYSLIQAQFQGFEIAEAHGILAALAIMPQKQLWETWAQEVALLTDKPEALNEEILKILFEKTEQDLAAKDFSFSLLIPESEEGLEERLEGLYRWCQGYLYGLGVSGANLTQLDDDGEDFMGFLSHFTTNSLNALTKELANEAERESEALALEELVEFVRVSALLLFYHFRNPNTSSSQESLH